MWDYQRDQIVVSLGSEGESDGLVLPVPAQQVDRALSLGGEVVGSWGRNGEGKEDEVVFVRYEEKSGDSLRRMVRDKYGNGKWNQFFQLAGLISQGGSLSMDDKLYIFPNISIGEESQEVIRFENGVSVEEFREIRANPRCLLECQFLHWRSIYEDILGIAPSKVNKVVLYSSFTNEPIIPLLLSQIFDLPIFSSSASPNLSSSTFRTSPSSNVNSPPLERLALSPTDKSPFLLYGSMLKEHKRLSDIVKNNTYFPPQR